jgi:phosphatidate phosphatase APP1
MGIRSKLRDVAITLDREWDNRRLELLRSVGGLDELKILTYRGFGRPDRLFLKGRVLVDRGDTSWESDDDLWDDLVNMYRRLHTTEIPGARVRASAAGAMVEVMTDHEGFFDVELEAGDIPFSPPRQTVDLELLEPERNSPVVATGEVVVRSPQASFLVVSDIDDTILHTQATNLLAMARATFLGNAKSRTAFPGVASLYSALVDGRSGEDDNPLVFISRSPWNLYDLFDQFCDLQGIPKGRIFHLRDWGISLEGLAKARPKGHKFGVIQKILDFEPDLPVLLIGDRGQKDPEIYHAISDEQPGRLLAAFIRNVTHDPLRRRSIDKLAAEVDSDGAEFHLVDDSLEIARHAAEDGWIRSDQLEKIAADVEAAGAPSEPLDELIETRPSSGIAPPSADAVAA